MLKRFFEEEEGQVMVEYGLITALIALVSVAVLGVLRRRMILVFNRVTNALDTSTNS